MDDAMQRKEEEFERLKAAVECAPSAAAAATQGEMRRSKFMLEELCRKRREMFHDAAENAASSMTVWEHKAVQALLVQQFAAASPPSFVSQLVM